jgi:subtilisin family serine protease
VIPTLSRPNVTLLGAWVVFRKFFIQCLYFSNTQIRHRAKGVTDYVYDSTAGAGTCAYIIDTGIRINHTDFSGRATFVKNYDTVDGTDEDLFGHGTHVAGTIGSDTYGVAKATKLHAMKVCNQFGMCDVSGVNQAILDTITDSAKRDCPNGVVINMSLGAPNDQWKSLRQAVKAAADAGIFVAVAAGNSAADAATFSPASAEGACAVGAADKDDKMADFSNFGKPLVVFAPGVDVVSAYKDGKTYTMSGTSMASPHIAGLAAYLFGLNGKQSPTALCQTIADMSTKNVLSAVPDGTVNKVAFNGQA